MKKKKKPLTLKRLMKAIGDYANGKDETLAVPALTYDDLRYKIIKNYTYQVGSNNLAATSAKDNLSSDEVLIVLNSFENLGLPAEQVAGDVYCFTEMGPYPLNMLHVERNPRWCPACGKVHDTAPEGAVPENN